jgi:segregation and condensation protein A
MSDKSSSEALETNPTETGSEKSYEETDKGAYKIKLEAFEGPLDLLLYLIKKDEINIYDIPIARITEQYLVYLNLMEELDIAVAGEFLVMAATLIHIKSRMLLPPDPTVASEGLEDPRQELVDRLLEHQKYKQAASMLHSRSEVEQAVFTRGPIETDTQAPELSATVFDLLEIFRSVLERAKEIAEMEIARDEITMAEKLTEIHEILKERDTFSVRELFERARSKRELILTFLAVLELVKEAFLRLRQAEVFGDIIAHKRMPEAPVDEREELDGTADL